MIVKAALFFSTLNNGGSFTGKFKARTVQMSPGLSISKGLNRTDVLWKGFLTPDCVTLPRAILALSVCRLHITSIVMAGV